MNQLYTELSSCIISLRIQLSLPETKHVFNTALSPLLFLLELRQLRSDTSLELGCDARGHSRAGNDAAIWYCVIVAGRPGVELSKKRQVSFKWSIIWIIYFICVLVC